jgi:peptide/nickel transport system permease protein
MPQRWRLWTALTPASVIGLSLVVAFVLTAILGPWLPLADPEQQQLSARLTPPVGINGTWDHPLGTDGLGRDVLARIVAGARVSFIVGVTATVVAGLIGVTLGLLAGGMGGIVDRVVSWLTDVQLAIPFVLTGIAVASVLGPSLRKVIIILAITGWVSYARIVRLQARSFLAAPWMEAARSVGASPPRLLFRHLLPNLLSPDVIVASQQVAGMILYEASLSYLGLGVPVETITWGGLVAAGKDQLPVAWWVSTIPGVALALTVLGFNLVLDWISDRMR